MEDSRPLWREYSKVYDEVFSVLPYRSLLLELVDALELTGSSSILDVGCGTGNLLWALKDQGVKCHWTGLDFSKEMLAKAADKAADYAGKTDFINADLNAPLADWSLPTHYDRIICNNVLWAIEDPTAFLKKLSEAARVGALLVVSTPKPNADINELLDEHLHMSEAAGLGREEALAQMMPRLNQVLKCNELLFRRYGDDRHLPREHTLRQWFADAGWSIYSVTKTYAGQNWCVVAQKS